MAFDCYFLGGVSEFTIQGDTIRSTDEEGNEVFRHIYDYVETDENGFYIYQSEDEDSGQFTYFSASDNAFLDVMQITPAE